MEPPRLLTPAEVATLLHLEPWAVRRLATTGRITFIRTPTGVRRYHEQSVLAYQASTSRSTT